MRGRAGGSGRGRGASPRVPAGGGGAGAGRGLNHRRRRRATRARAGAYPTARPLAVGARPGPAGRGGRSPPAGVRSAPAPRPRTPSASPARRQGTSAGIVSGRRRARGARRRAPSAVPGPRPAAAQPGAAGGVRRRARGAAIPRRGFEVPAASAPALQGGGAWWPRRMPRAAPRGLAPPGRRGAGSGGPARGAVLRRALPTKSGTAPSPPAHPQRCLSFVHRLWSEGPGAPCGLCTGFSHTSVA